VDGDLTRAAIAAQLAWLRAVPERVGDLRLPTGTRVLYTGCGTSFHAAQTGGMSAQALEVVLGNAPPADVLVAVSHEGGSTLTREAVRAFDGETWVVAGRHDGPIAGDADRVVVVAPHLEESYCHTAAYTSAIAGIAALQGLDVSRLPDAVAEQLAAPPLPLSGHDRWLVAGAGRDWPTAQEAALKLREGAFVAAEAWETEQLLHGPLAAVDETVRCFVLEGEGRGAERARDAVAALRELGCDVALVPTTHPAVDIVAFQRLAVDLALSRGVNPDLIRWDDPRWKAARGAYE
jgi:glutamine---fructose-6-phosphate transaminase (isomerizing)